ncbi:MAG: hypothetical protein RLZZ565_502, partial [Planctomycetota bacterium]
MTASLPMLAAAPAAATSISIGAIAWLAPMLLLLLPLAMLPWWRFFDGR